jgi:hypothetical protein
MCGASCDNCKQPLPAATTSAWFQDGCGGFAALELPRFKSQYSLASTAKEKWRKIIADVGLGKPPKQSPSEDKRRLCDE